jgi:hypothetical protein
MMGCGPTMYGSAHSVPAAAPTTAPAGLGSTAANLFLRTHTFNKNQDRPSGPTATGMPEPAHYYQK